MNSYREPGQQPLPLSLCCYLQHWEDPFIREEQAPSVELVRALLGWLESKEGPFSVGAKLLATAALFSESVMPGRIELHFLRNTTPQETAGFILPDLDSTP